MPAVKVVPNIGKSEQASFTLTSTTSARLVSKQVGESVGADKILFRLLTKLAVSRCRQSWQGGYITPDTKRFVETLLDNFFAAVIDWENISSSDMDALDFGYAKVNDLVTLRKIPVYLERALPSTLELTPTNSAVRSYVGKVTVDWDWFKNNDGITRHSNFNDYRIHHQKGTSATYISLGILPKTK